MKRGHAVGSYCNLEGVVMELIAGGAVHGSGACCECKSGGAELIARGAEAELYKSEYLGERVLVKERVRKKYRNPELDERIRRLRTKEECLLLHRVKGFGVRAPCIYKIDRKGTTIVMEFIEGRKLKDVLGENKKTKRLGVLCREVGKNIGKMHRNGLVHGDLTTSNIILAKTKRKKQELVFVDFGLGFMSRKGEDFAVDLLVFKKTFNATHWKLMPRGWELILEGYLREWPQGKGIVERISDVEGRVRYH